jgi:hypothetical protein
VSDAELTVVAVTATGHVLAALTRTADPTTALPAEALAGSGLLVRTAPAAGAATDPPQFSVPATELEVTVIAFQESVLLDPRRFRLVKPPTGDPTTQEITLPANKKGVELPPANLTRTSLTLTVDPAPAADAAAWVLLQDGAGTAPVALTGKVRAGQTASDPIPHQLDAGVYEVLALVAGYPPLLVRNRSVP